MRVLAGDPERHLIHGAVDPRQRSSRLNRVGDQPLIGVRVLDHDIGGREGSINVAALDHPVEHLVVGGLFVELWGVVIHRFADIHDDRQRVVVDDDGKRRVLGIGFRVGNHDGDGVADVSHRVDGDRRMGRGHRVRVGHHPCAGNTAVSGIGHVLAGEHGSDAWHCCGSCGVDPLELGVGDR